MTALVLGLDPSPLRLGWGLVRFETGEAVACGMEPLDLPHKGWSHQQTADALRAIPDHGEVVVVAVEWPTPNRLMRGEQVVNIGRALQEAVAACQRRWPHAPVNELRPAEWRKLAGLPGNATKDDVRVFACGYMFDASLQQDAADALLIALAGQRRNADSWDRAVARGAA